MKANKFVEKFGWDEAIRVVSQAPKSDCAYSLDLEIYLNRYAFSKYEVYIDDLKRLVESHELVERLGGLESCNRLISQYGCCESSDHLRYHVTNVESCGGIKNAKKRLSTEQSEPYYNYDQQIIDRLKQAILDVESYLAQK